MIDARLAALMAALNAERIAGFPSGRLFLDSIEQAIAAALVDAYAGHNPSVPQLRGGLGPARLRLVKELVHARIEDELTLGEMAQSAVLRQRVERAKEMLREAEMRVLDVAVACGFKTQQHFARVFRRICGVSPTEYRCEVLR
jgi:AraC family transcriptional regulator